MSSDTTSLEDSVVQPTQVIGLSTEGRGLELIHLGVAEAPLRILLLAGQHGDERSAVKALRRLAGQLSPAELSDDLQVALLPCLNPDGYQQRRRTNAAGIDLNRDHQLLQSVENQALHCFVRAWRPQLIIDVHTYPPRRKHLLAHGLVYAHDLFVDTPSHPALNCLGWAGLGPALVEALTETLADQGYRSGRYTLVNRRGRVRHSTPDAVDARNGLALRFGILTLLLEGRKAPRHEGRAARQRTEAAIQASLRWLLGWVRRYAAALAVDQPAAGEEIAIRSRYGRAEGRYRLAFGEAGSGTIHSVELPGKYTPQQRVTRRVALPTAYAVPSEFVALLDVLARHGFATISTMGETLMTVEQTQIISARPARRGWRTPRRLLVERQIEERNLDRYQLFPTAQPGGWALAVLLEAESKYGLARYPQLGLTLHPGSIYPILRVNAAAG